MRASSTAQPRPNVLIILTDDQRLDGTMEVMPKTRAWFHTGGEHSDGRPFEGGTFFPNGVVTTPLCAPSRASLLTGRYAHNHGVHSNWVVKDDPRAATNKARGPARFFQQLESSLPLYLQGAGYRTGIVGRYFALFDIFDSDLAPHPLPGWDEYALVGHAYSGFEVNDNGVRKSIARYSTDYLAARAEEFLDKAGHDERPWFLYLATIAPHTPHLPAPRHGEVSVPPLDTNNPAYFAVDPGKPPWTHTSREDADATERAWPAYLRTLKAVDDLVDRVMRRVEDLGETDTLAFFSSDHGLHWGEHGLRRKERPYRESLCVPFFMRWPGRVGSSYADDRHVANIDIAPTVIAAVNGAGGPQIDPAPPMDGISLIDTEQPPRSRILTEHFGAGPARSLARNYYAGQSPSWASIGTSSFQYIEYYRTYLRDPSDPVEVAKDSPEGAATRYLTDFDEVIGREYYDLESDPHQLENLLGDPDAANDPPTELLHSLLIEDRSCGAPPKRPCAPQPGDNPVSAPQIAKPRTRSRDPSDSRAPKTQIELSPGFSPNRAAATFYVGCATGGGHDPREVRYECRLSVAGREPPPFRPCGATDVDTPKNFVMKTYDGLVNGITYTFEARAIDLEGNADPSPPTYTWQVGPLRTFSNVPDLAAPEVSGDEVRAIVPDGEGGWYVAGDFTDVNGVPRRNLVHIVEEASGQLVVDAAWAPQTDGVVTTVALARGVLYVGGAFTSVTGTNGRKDRIGLAAITAEGAVTDWDPRATDDSPALAAATVHALVLDPGSAPTSIYAGGDFSRIGGASVGRVAKLDLASGTPDADWNPEVLGGTVHALAVTEGQVYLGGTSISSIGGEARSALAEVDRRTGAVTEWNPAPTGGVVPLVHALELRQRLGGLDTILVAGHFSSIGSPPEPRNNVAEVNLADEGSVTSWDPQLGPGASGSVRATVPFFCPHPGEPMAPDPTCSIIVGGEFDTVKTAAADSAPRAFLAETDRGSGDPSDRRAGSANDWDPRLDGPPLAIACWAPSPRRDADPKRVLAVGGLFESVGGAPRRRLAFFRAEPFER